MCIFCGFAIIEFSNVSKCGDRCYAVSCRNIILLSAASKCEPPSEWQDRKALTMCIFCRCAIIEFANASKCGERRHVVSCWTHHDTKSADYLYSFEKLLTKWFILSYTWAPYIEACWVIECLSHWFHKSLSTSVCTSLSEPTVMSARLCRQTLLQECD